MYAKGVLAMKLQSMLLMIAVTAGTSPVAFAAPPESAVMLTGDPVVMRLSKDEFRIVFGIEGRSCKQGSNGSVRYRVHWTASDGTSRSEQKQVNYTVSPDAARTIAVDRQYLDTAEGAHPADVVIVQAVT